MQKDKKPSGYWSLKTNCRKAANKCQIKSEMQRRFNTAYVSSLKNGWIDEFFPNSSKRGKKRLCAPSLCVCEKNGMRSGIPFRTTYRKESPAPLHHREAIAGDSGKTQSAPVASRVFRQWCPAIEYGGYRPTLLKINSQNSSRVLIDLKSSGFILKPNSWSTSTTTSTISRESIPISSLRRDSA